jgi:VanZ family protein
MSRASQYFDRGAGAQRPAHLLVALITIGVVALITFGSLYPFDIEMPQDQSTWQSLWYALAKLSWARSGRSDRISNVLLYVPLGFCAFLNFDGRVRRSRAVWCVLLFGALLSFSSELTQVFIPTRVASYWDLVCNIGGTSVGIVGGVAWRILSARLATEPSTSDLTALLGLCAWFAWRWAPFDLHMGLSAFKAALQPLSGPQFELGHCLQYLVWWLVVAELVFAWVNRARATESLLSVIAITLAGRFFSVDAPLIASELLALVLLLPTLVMLHRLQGPLRQYLIAAAFIANYLWITLPFGDKSSATLHAMAQHGFDWWPFVGWMNAGLPVDIRWLARQLFLLISAAWLLRKAGMSSRIAIYWITASVFALECLNVAAGYSGSLTLPVIALVSTSLLYLLGQNQGQLSRPRAHNR